MIIIATATGCGERMEGLTKGGWRARGKFIVCQGWIQPVSGSQKGTNSQKRSQKRQSFGKQSRMLSATPKRVGLATEGRTPLGQTPLK
jgi:hypothetical protein